MKGSGQWPTQSSQQKAQSPEPQIQISGEWTNGLIDKSMNR